MRKMMSELRPLDVVVFLERDGWTELVGHTWMILWIGVQSSNPTMTSIEAADLDTGGVLGTHIRCLETVEFLGSITDSSWQKKKQWEPGAI
jgi:hypothetical protein